MFISLTLHQPCAVLERVLKPVLFQLEEQRRVEEEYDEKLRLEREARDQEERELGREVGQLRIRSQYQICPIPN